MDYNDNNDFMTLTQSRDNAVDSSDLDIIKYDIIALLPLHVGLNKNKINVIKSLHKTPVSCYSFPGQG